MNNFGWVDIVAAAQCWDGGTIVAWKMLKQMSHDSRPSIDCTWIRLHNSKINLQTRQNAIISKSYHFAVPFMNLDLSMAK